MNTPRRLPAILISATLLAAGLGSPRAVFAQNALGDGTALDANLQTGSSGVNPRGRDFAAEARFRNAIVTGNVPGGLSFRGDIGYRGGDDFRGSLGSDTLFDFQRDSFYSGLGTRGISGINALQATLAYTVSGQSQGLLGGLIINSPGSGTAIGDVTARNATPAFDIYGNIRGTLRAPSGTTLTGIERPDVLSTVSNESGQPVGLMSSSDLLGIRAVTPTNPILGGFDTDYEQRYLERLRNGLPPEPGPDDDEAGRLPRTYDTILRELGGEAAINQAAGQRPSGASGETGEGTGADTTNPGLPGAGNNDRDNEPGNEPAVDPLRSLRDALSAAREPVLVDPMGGPQTGEAGDAADEPGEASMLEEVRRAIEETEDLLGKSVQVDAFVGSTDNPDYVRHLEAAERLLAEGEWFRAEERFSAAINLVPGDPVAALGRMHAQLAAGMYLSAGTNLRSLYEAYPEMMTARLDAKYLPSGDRLTVIREQLRFRIERPTILSAPAAALLAYLGVQTGNADDVEHGLSEFRRMTDDPETGEPDPFALVLQAAWSAASKEQAPEGERQP